MSGTCNAGSNEDSPPNPDIVTVLQRSHGNNLLLREERKTRSLQAAGEAAAFIWRSTIVGTVTDMMLANLLPELIEDIALFGTESNF